MTGLEKMVSQILEEADASAAVMISDAEKKAAEILGEAGEKADKIRQQREEQSRAKVKSYEERTASAADMKKRTAVLAAKQELIGKVIADACDRVKNLDEGKYFEILKSMEEKYLLPREGEICFSKKDLERMPANFREEIKGLAQKKGGKPASGCGFLHARDGGGKGSHLPDAAVLDLFPRRREAPAEEQGRDHQSDSDCADYAVLHHHPDVLAVFV